MEATGLPVGLSGKRFASAEPAGLLKKQPPKVMEATAHKVHPKALFLIYCYGSLRNAESQETLNLDRNAFYLQLRRQACSLKYAPQAVRRTAAEDPTESEAQVRQNVRRSKDCKLVRRNGLPYVDEPSTKRLNLS
jgi:ribosomal protein L36